MQQSNQNKYSQKIFQKVPQFIKRELKKSKRPIAVRDNISSKLLQKAIIKDFQGVEQGFITEEKINKVYEGIIDIKYVEKGLILFFKNIIDNDILIDLLFAYQIKSLNFIIQTNNIDIIGITLTQMQI